MHTDAVFFPTVVTNKKKTTNVHVGFWGNEPLPKINDHKLTFSAATKRIIQSRCLCGTNTTFFHNNNIDIKPYLTDEKHI